jgi:hypothetical protein
VAPNETEKRNPEFDLNALVPNAIVENSIIHDTPL